MCEIRGSEVVNRGNYDWNPCTTRTTALKIYQQFLTFSYITEANKKYTTLKFKNSDSENSKYQIHVFSKPRTNQQRKVVCVHAGIFLGFEPSV